MALAQKAAETEKSTHGYKEPLWGVKVENIKRDDLVLIKDTETNEVWLGKIKNVDLENRSVDVDRANKTDFGGSINCFVGGKNDLVRGKYVLYSLTNDGNGEIGHDLDAGLYTLKMQGSNRDISSGMFSNINFSSYGAVLGNDRLEYYDGSTDGTDHHLISKAKVSDIYQIINNEKNWTVTLSPYLPNESIESNR